MHHLTSPRPLEDINGLYNMTRLDIINHLIREYSIESFLEIGVFTGEILDGCVAKNKIGVDPDLSNYKGNSPTFKGTSDEFFAGLSKGTRFGLVHIDGLHHSEQVTKDIENALQIVPPKGFIVLHDCNPPTSVHAVVPRTLEIAEWNGDVYKSVINFRSKYEPAYKFQCVDTDWGVGIISRRARKGKSHRFSDEPVVDISWEFFDENRQGCLNLITPEDFIKQYKRHEGNTK